MSKQIEADEENSILETDRASSLRPTQGSGLLPCPFCGRHKPRLAETGDNPFFTIKCADCPCEMRFFSSTRQQAIDRWNARFTQRSGAVNSELNQNSDSGGMQQTAPCFSQTAFTKDSSESVAQRDVCAQCESNARWNDAGGYKESAAECRAYCLRGHRSNPITQDGASASALSTTITDHSQASLPESKSSESNISSVALRAAEKILRMHSEGVTDATWEREVQTIADIIITELSTLPESIEVSEEDKKPDQGFNYERVFRVQDS